MVIVGLIGTGFLVLLVAPTVHRRINARSRASAEASRVARANELRSSSDGAVREFDDGAAAIRVRDRLLLRGVRAEVVRGPDHVSLIHRAVDAAVVDAVIDELDTD